MKNKISIILLLLTSFSIFSQSINTDHSILIYQDNYEISKMDGKYQIEEKPFEIVIRNVNDSNNIAIFAYHTDEMFDKYSYPIRTSETVMFAPATGLAMTIDDDKSFYLRINKEMTQNYITSDRRVNYDNNAILRINGFADTYNRYSQNKIAYLSIFIDFNDNDIIENNEIKNITIKVNQSTEQIEKPKVYISTMGSTLEIIGEDHSLYDSFILFKITNIVEAKKFSEFMRYNTNYYRGLRKAGITNIDYSIKNKYFLLTPKGLQIEAYQPYHYSGEYELIFDILDTDEEKPNTYCSLRTYTVSKEDDIFELLVNWDNRYIKPVLITGF